MGKENKNDKKIVANGLESAMDRRKFLRFVGKTIGIVALTHFVPVGAVASSAGKGRSNARDVCKPGQTNQCEYGYTCNSTNIHSCKNAFECAKFTCNPASANVSQNPCNPMQTFSE